ncbi:MAG: GNAT family N-acetyltransferase [Armatimonadetes bacterium]|nr:GNAT family N-acetyltransferase [Armatimonadota bacterium]
MGEEFRAVKPGELEECLDLWGIVFERVGRGYFPPYFYGDPWSRRVYTRVCAVDGRLVSTVQICERRVRFGDSEIVMGGIGNVATLPEFRGKGYSQRLLSDCARVIVPQRMLAGRIRADLPKQPSKYSVRICDWTADLEAIHRVYDVFNDGRSFTTVRTPEYWKGYLSARFGKPEFTLAAESGGRIVGYIFFGSDSPNLWLKEIGWLPGHEDCAGVLIREVVKRARELGNGNLHANLPHEPEILAAVERVVEEIEPREPMGMMCRITNMRSLAERALPELNRRAEKTRLPDCAISLDTEVGSLRLTIRKSRVSLGARNPIRVPLSQLEFFCLLFGIKSADELGLCMPRGTAEIISALFPPQRSVFWLADHF